MRSKFQLNEGEVKRILNLHRNAILKETKQIIEEAETVTIKTDKVEFNVKGDNLGDNLRLFKGTTFKPSEKIPNSLITTKKVYAQFVQTATFRLKVYGQKNKAYVVYNCKTKNFYLLGVTEENLKDRKDYRLEKSAVWESGGNMRSLDNLCTKIPAPTSEDEVNLKTDKCAIRKPKVDGKVAPTVISYYYDGKSKCETGQGTKGFSSIEDCTKKCVTKKKKEDNTKDDYGKILPDIDDEDEIVRGGESDDDNNKIGCENRPKTLECRSGQIKCDTKAIRAQALINCNCPSNILDAVLRGYPKGRKGNVGGYTLIEDGIWGSASKAAWETCEELIKKGTSDSDGQKNPVDDNKDNKSVVDDKNKNVTQTPKDLKLTPEEFAKLIQ